MKKFLFLLISIMTIALVSSAHATVFTFFDSDLMVVAETYDNPVDNATLNSRTDVTPGGVQYDIDLTGSDFSQIQIGYDKPVAVGGTLPSTYYDLTAYDTFELYFTNISTTNDWFMANLYINTGWTDDPWAHDNLYTENGWTWVAPGNTAHLVLDLTGLGTVTGPNGNTGVGDDRRKWVSGIGFNIGTNIGDGDYSGCNIDVQVDPVPEPATMLLLGAGLIGLAGVRRKFKK